MNATTLSNLKKFDEAELREARKSNEDFHRLLEKPHASIETYVNKSSDPLTAIERLGQWIAKCGMFGCERSEQGNIIALSCIELGISLTEFARTYDLVKGKLRKKALAAQVDFENLGGVVEWISIGDDNSGKAEAKIAFKGQSRLFTFTLADAEKAKIFRGSDSNWEKWQSEMLCARVLSRGIARMCPRVYAGCEDTDDAPAPALQLPTDPPKPTTISTQATPASVESVTRECGPKVEPEKGKANTAPQSSTPAGGLPENHERGQVSTTPVKTKGTPDWRQSEIGTIPLELANEVAVAIGAHQPAAIDWMLRQNPPWITREQIASVENPFVFLTEPRAKKIIAQIAGFIRNVNLKPVAK